MLIVEALKENLIILYSAGYSDSADLKKHNNMFYQFLTYNVIIISQISKEVKSIYRADL